MYRIIGVDGKEYGPISADQLRQWIAENRANAATQVLAEGATEWKPLGSLPEFFPPSTGAAWPGSATSPAGTAHAPGAPAVFPVATASFPKNNGLAITGLVLGIVSMTLGFCCCYAFPFSITGLVISIIGLVQIKNNPERYTGKGLAIAGIILCGLSLLIALLLMLVVGLSSGLDGISHRGQRL